jgi:hypothetical protein
LAEHKPPVAVTGVPASAEPSKLFATECAIVVYSTFGCAFDIAEMPDSASQTRALHRDAALGQGLLIDTLA